MDKPMTAPKIEEILDKGFQKCITSDNKYGIKDLAAEIRQAIKKALPEEKECLIVYPFTPESNNHQGYNQAISEMIERIGKI